MAGFIVAKLKPNIGHDSHFAVKLAMALVRDKLGRTGFESNGAYQRMLVDADKRLRRQDDAMPIFESLQPFFNADVIKGVLVGLFVWAITSGIQWFKDQPAQKKRIQQNTATRRITLPH